MHLTGKEICPISVQTERESGIRIMVPDWIPRRIYIREMYPPQFFFTMRNISGFMIWRFQIKIILPEITERTKTGQDVSGFQNIMEKSARREDSNSQNIIVEGCEKADCEK